MRAFVGALSTFRMSSAPTPSKFHAVRCIDRPGALSVRRENRPAHLEWADSSGVVFAGPLLAPPAEGGDPAPCGSLLVMDGPRDTVRESLAKDPYKTAGLFDTVDVRPWVCGMRSDAVTAAAGESVYCVWCVDKSGKKDLRAATRPSHLDWWRQSGRKGMIGPFPAEDGNGAIGTMLVCNGASLSEVAAWAATDPYNKADLFEAVHVAEMSITIDKFFSEP